MFMVYEKYVPATELREVCKTYLHATDIYDGTFNPNTPVELITHEEAAKKAIEGTNLDSVWVDTFEYWMDQLWDDSIEWADAYLKDTDASSCETQFKSTDELLKYAVQLRYANVPTIRVVEFIMEDGVASVFDITEYKSTSTAFIRKDLIQINVRGNKADIYGVKANGDLVD